ncbi:hypothetical protein ACHQM5_020462 [Ranunculus cassubicifolius]
MPLRRYQIRNEYSLADPELYRAADKDDPEALLEGVAMAGLVGVLRQLGDLAEFAAEIFHNLHEEVMATAARGHGLTLRVQQLEIEFPSIEKAFLSQTSHSLFLQNSGVDWHSNLRLDQNLITQGDLPRFVMDSYEECRGPPRLFLLDKFDVAGAGACLKRYTDPSFFKAEFSTSEAAKEELKRDKKYRKIKKKGSRWRTGDNPEVTASHFKLHQLLLEERSESQNNVQHTHLVKLKRRHSSNSLVSPTSGKSYMEKILNSRSPDRNFVRGSSAISSHLPIETNNIGGLVLEREIHENGPVDHFLRRDRIRTVPHSSKEKVLKGSVDEFLIDDDEERNPEKLIKPVSDIELESITSINNDLEDKKGVAFTMKDNTEVNGKEYHSDDNSEIDNYTDALTTMDSEVETDTESKLKYVRKFKTEKKFVNSETIKEPKELHALFLDSRSIASEDGNDSIENGKLSPSYSDTLSNSAESVPSDGDLAAKVHPSAGLGYANTSSKDASEIMNSSITGSPEHVVNNGAFNEVSDITTYSSNFRGASSDFDAITFDVVDSVTGQLSPNSKNDGNSGHDVSSTANFSDIYSQSRPELLSLGPHGGQPAGVFNIGNPESPNSASADLTNILRPAPEERMVDDDTEEPLSPSIADESHEKQMTAELDSPDSVLLNTERELYELAEKDLESGSGTGSASECRPGPSTSYDVNNYARPDTQDIINKKESEISDQAVSVESNVAEVGIGDSVADNRLESGMSILSGSDVETPSSNVEHNMPDGEVKDGHAPESIQFDSSVSEIHRNASDELPLDAAEPAPATDAPLEAAKSNDVDNTVSLHNAIDSSNWEVAQNTLSISRTSIADNFEAYDQSLNTECRQTDLNHSEDTGLPSSTKENNPVEVLKQPSSYKAGDLLEEHEEYDAREDHWWSLQQNGESTKSPYHEYEHVESPNHTDLDGCSIAPPESCPMEHLSQSVDLKPSPTSSHEFERSEPSQFSLQPIFQRTGAINDQVLDTQPQLSLLDISLSADDDEAMQEDMVNEAPPLPPLPPIEWRIGKSPTSRGGITSTSFNTLSAEATVDSELADPLIPFSQHPTSPQPRAKPSSLEVPQMVSEPRVPNSTNPFLTLTDGDHEHDSSNSGEELWKPTSFTTSLTSEDLNTPMTLQEQVEQSEMLAPSASALSSLIEDEEHEHHSPSMEGELKWESKSLAPLKDVDPQHTASTVSPIIEDEEGHDSRSLEGEFKWKSLTPIKHSEETLLYSESRAWQPESSSTIYEEEEHSEGLEGELKWQSNSNTMLPVVEYGKPNGSLKSMLSRPRTPLIEAVASHDKRNLRKATERILPQAGPQLDERNSLLEQIRAKSFNLKPAIATRPSVQGPSTNLKVVAILEKANAIRQALAGSDDEDTDEDTWSE